MKNDKEIRLKKLVQKRKRFPLEIGYRYIADYHWGTYECKHVSPYSKTAGNLSADVFVMLQDWCSDDYLGKESVCEDSRVYGHSLKCPSNINLKRLLKTHFDLELKDTYGTNLFPFIKPGKMNAKIHPDLLNEAAVEFGLPQVDIISPKLVICFGVQTFSAMRIAVGFQKVGTVNEGIGKPFPYKKSEIWLQTHPAQQAQNTRGMKQVSADWERMKVRVKS